MNNGWVKLHRKILDWEWYDDHNTCRLFIHIILKATHKGRKWKGKDIETGSFVSGRITLAAETGLSEQKIRTSLNKLKSTNEITIKSYSKYSIISVNNWKSMQSDNHQDNQEVTNKQPTDNQQVTTDKNVKKAKNVNKFIKPSIDELEKYFLDRKVVSNPKEEAEKFVDHFTSNGWKVGGKAAMRDWKSAVRNWEKRWKKTNPSYTNQPQNEDKLFKDYK